MFSKFQNHKFTKTPRAEFDFFKNSLWPTLCTLLKKKNPTQSWFQHSCQDRLSQIRLFIDKLLMSFSLSAEVQAKSLRLTPTCLLRNNNRDRNRDLFSLTLLLRFYIVIPHPQSPTKTALFVVLIRLFSEVYGTELPEMCAEVWTVCLLFISSVILTRVHTSVHRTFTCMKRGRVT